MTGPASVVDAVASGERAAVGIDEYLSGEKHAFWRQDRQVDTFFDPEADPVEYPRSKGVCLPPRDRKGNSREVDLPWPEAIAIREAKRCLRCDFKETCSTEREESHAQANR